MLGKYVQQRPEIARAVAEAGHAIGNHSFTHPNLIFASDAELRQQLEETSKVIEEATGSYRFYFVHHLADAGRGRSKWLRN